MHSELNHPRYILVMIVLSSPGVGRRKRGFESSLQILSSELQSRGIECKLLGSHQIPSPNMDSKILSKLSSILRMNLGYRLEMGIFALGLSIYLVKNRPSVLIVMDPAIAKTIYFLLKRYRDRPLTILWNGGPVQPPYFYVDLVAQTNVQLLKDTLAVEPSQFYLPHFIPSNFHPKCSREEARKFLNIEEEKIVILCVSAVNETHKKVSSLFTQLSKINLSEKYLFLLVGNIGSESQSVFRTLYRLQHKLSWKHITLESHQMYLAYSASDVSILWSKREGFGMCILESISYELPMIVRNDSDVIATFQDLLICVSDSNSDELKEKLQTSLKLSSLELKEKSQIVQKKFNVDSIIETLNYQIQNFSRESKFNDH